MQAAPLDGYPSIWSAAENGRLAQHNNSEQQQRQRGRGKKRLTGAGRDRARAQSYSRPAPVHHAHTASIIHSDSVPRAHLWLRRDERPLV